MSAAPDEFDVAEHNERVHGVVWHRAEPSPVRLMVAWLIVGLAVGAAVALAVGGVAVEVYGVRP